jgi:uncharacterized protein
LNDFLSLLILFGVGIAAGFLNVSAGGGSTLTLPALIFLGLDASVANGTNRIAIIIQNIAAIYSFKKEKFHQFGLSLKLSMFTLPGVVIGAVVATRISDVLFEKILGIIMILIILSMIIPRKKIKTDEKPGKLWMVYASMFGIGFYGGFVQVGVGFIIMAALYYLMRLSLVYVNMHKVFVVFVYTIPALVVFIVTDNVNWVLGLCLAAGNAIGGWWAAKFSVKGGEKFIKIVLMIAILIMALKLLKVF